MPIRVAGDGPVPCRIMVVGERPGADEIRARFPRSFIGPAGRELWARLWDTCALTRDEVFVTNLVRTFSPKPPSKEEVARDRLDLMAEVYRVRPEVIIAVGYHAARFFLPQFEGVNGDKFHGLAFRYSYGTVTRRTAAVVPIVHASAALRSPGRYQQQLTEDLRAAHLTITGAQPFHDVVQPPVYHQSLATTIADASDLAISEGVLGLDSEGSITRPWVPECVSLSAYTTTASLINLHDADGPDRTGRLGFLQQAIDRAGVVCAHHFKHDIKALHAAGVTVPEHKWDDSMVMAYILNLPQGLKELCARLLGWSMSEYWDLITPLDDARVKHTLKEYYDAEKSKVDDSRRAASPPKSVRGTKRVRRHAEGVREPEQGADLFREVRHEASEEPSSGHTAEELSQHDQDRASDGIPTRALTSLRAIIEKDADTTRRERWEGSKFAGLVTLPPAPTWKDLPQAIREPYALTDAVAHRTIRNTLWKRIEAEGLEEVYYVDMGVLPFLARTEEVGMACDGDRLRALSTQFAQEFEDTCLRINELAGREVNPLSGEQVSECLFKELGIRPTNLTKSKKHFQTGDKYLKARRGDHDIVQLVLDARQLNKYRSTYTAKLPGMLQDGRYYPNWKYTRTATGRLAEEVILLIPKHDPMAKVQGRMNRAKAIRNCFHATKGHTLVSVDLSQIELRAMAEVSGCVRLLDAFRKGEDPHAQVAHQILGAPARKEDQDESEHRLPAKTYNFSIINGTTEYGVLDQLHEAGLLHWTLDIVREHLADWFSVYWEVKKFWEGEIAHALEHGYVTSMHGRRRYLAGLHSHDDRIVKETERQCLFKIQSSADEISKLWGRLIWKKIIRPYQKRGVYCEPWVRVHDDTTLEVDSAIAEEVAEQMLALVPQILSIPTPAEAKMGTEWGDLH